MRISSKQGIRRVSTTHIHGFSPIFFVDFYVSPYAYIFLNYIQTCKGKEGIKGQERRKIKERKKFMDEKGEKSRKGRNSLPRKKGKK